MKIEYYQEAANFGDALNPWIWPRLLPDFFDEDGQTVFLGIGSIIGMTPFPPTIRKILFGAAYVPEYNVKPDVTASDWHVYFVRGPRSARLLGLPESFALGDPAILLHTLLKKPENQDAVSFMPHWESVVRGNWAEACRRAGIRLIDPQDAVGNVLGQLSRTKLLIAESMHGAIVADALRIPWIPVLPLRTSHRMKWADWAQTMGINLSPYRLWPSSLGEARLSFLRRPLEAPLLSTGLNDALTDLAAQRLVTLSQKPPVLSEDRVLAEVTDRMQDMMARLRRDYGGRQEQVA